MYRFTMMRSERIARQPGKSLRRAEDYSYVLYINMDSDLSPVSGLSVRAVELK